MEEINKNQKLEDFVKSLSKKYGLNENSLIDKLINDKNNFWDFLFIMISKISEPNNSFLPLDNENNDNINSEKIFKKEEILKEIENYFKENPDENQEILDKFKNGNRNDKKNSSGNLDTSPHSPISKCKILNSDSIKKLKRMPSPVKRKKSLLKKYNFQLGAPKALRHQSILGKIPKLNKINLNIINKNLTIKNKGNNKNNSKKIKKNRKSLILKIENNSNLEYNQIKKEFLPVKNRRSVFIQQNKFNFKFGLNNPKNDSKIKDSPKVIKEKNNFKSLLFKNKKDEKMLNFSDDSDSSSFDKSESRSDKDIKKKENKKLNKIIDINENDQNKNNKANEITENAKIENDNNITNENYKIKEENIKIKIYKNKNTYYKIYKKKNNLKSLSKPKEKKYLNIEICHQISIFLKSINSNDLNNNSNNYNINKNINNNKSSNNKNNNSNIKNHLNHPKKAKQKFEKIIKKTSKKLSKKNDKNEINNIKMLYKKDNEIETSKLSENEYNKNDNNEEANHNRSILSCDSKKAKIIDLKKNIKNPTIIINDITIYKNPLYNNFEHYGYNSERHFKLLNRTKIINPENSNYKPLSTIMSKKAEIKYYKSSNRSKNNSKYKNLSSRSDFNKLIKEDEIKKNNNNYYKKCIVKDNKKKVNKTTNNSKKTSKKKNYLQRYKEAIDNIMKNDNYIFKEESELIYLQKDNKVNKNNSTNINDIRKKEKNEFKNELKIGKKDKNKSKIKIKKNINNYFKNKYKF